MDLISTDMQLSRTHSARNVLSGSRAAGYMRVPSGGRTCALCEIASTQMYHTDVLMPIHPSCQCGVEIVTDSNPWDQAAADKRLEDTHASVFDRLGVNDAGGRAPDYRKIIVTNDHGEIGPMLGIKGQHFTGPDLKAAAYRTESSNTARNAAFAPKKTQEWGRVHADRLLPSDASLAERNRFASLLSQHPERVVKKVKSITVAASDAEMQAAAKAVGFTDAHGVAAFWDGKGITLKPGFDDVTFHHEMGHAVSDFTAKAKVKPYYDQYQISPQFDRHTDYSKTSPRESFAESYAAFVASGSPLKKVSDPYYELTFSVLRKVLS